MKSATDDLLSAFDGHQIDGVRAALAAGADAVTPIRGKPPIRWLLEEYTRSERLSECVRALIERGATLDDPCLLTVLLDDAAAVRRAAAADPGFLAHRTSLVSAFASLTDVTLLHVAAEYGHFAAAEALIDLGADVNACAGVDPWGIGGHTPIFHTVNSNANRSAPIMHRLIAAGACTDVRVHGLRWGEGYPWETIFFDVSPISFAQMGLLPQVHRRESEIYANIAALVLAADRPMPPLANVPNRYLLPKPK